MAMLELQQKQGLEPTKTWQRPLKQQISAAAATAQTFYVDIPRDSFIHELIIRVGESLLANNPGTVADDLLDIRLVGNGNKYMKDAFGLAEFFIQVEKMNGKRHAAGFYKLLFSDPLIPEAKPLPAWMFTSLQLILTDNAPAATMYHFIDVTIVESTYDPVRHGDLSNWKLLIEKCGGEKKYGNNTGWQDYEHERAYKVFSYLYASDDNGTLGDAVFSQIKVLGRNPKGEIIVADQLLWDVLKAENNALIISDLSAGYVFLQFANGFPTTEFTSLYSKLNIAAAGTQKRLRVLERYLL